MGSLRDRLDQDVEGWKPNPGDMVMGEVLVVDTRPSDYGDDYPYIEIEDEETSNVVGVHAFHTVLKNELARIKPQVGDTLGVKYIGPVEGKRTDSKGKVQTFEKYRVVHDSKNNVAPPAPDWNVIGESAHEEAIDQGIDPTEVLSPIPGGEEEPF